jgi:phenylpropionate dioxygenase-like ring-hydroxylating dioxygenase large terminal subunit
VTSYPTRYEQGLVWVFPTSDEASASGTALPLIPELDDPSFVDATDFYVRDLPYSWDKLVENLADPSHLPYAHHTMIKGADRVAALDLDLKITTSSPAGFAAVREPYPEGGGRYDFGFTAPTLVQYTLIPDGAKSGTHVGLGQYCIPTSPGSCRLITRFPFRLPVAIAMWFIRKTPRWITHLSQVR